MDIQLAEDLCGVEEMGVVDNPGIWSVYLREGRRGIIRNLLLSVPSNKRQVEDERQPVSVDEEEERQEGVDGGFGDDVGVEAVAEVDGVDVVAENLS